MSTTEVQLRFAAEFALFLACFAGLGYAASRHDLLLERRAARWPALAGFASLVTSAVLSGALIAEVPSELMVSAPRVAGAGLLVAASPWWRRGRGARALLVVGLALVLVAEVAVHGDVAPSAVAAALGLGAVAIGVALVLVSTRTISTRIAAAAATILFVVISTLAVALSAVITDNVQGEAIRRYGARAESEASAVTAQGSSVFQSATVLGTALGNTPDLAPDLLALTALSADPGSVAGPRRNVETAIDDFLSLLTDADPRLGPVLLVLDDGQIRAVINASGSVAGALSAADVVQRGIDTQEPVQSVAPIGEGAFAIAAAPVTLVGQVPEFRGVVVVTSRLDASYLTLRAAPIEQEQSGAGLTLTDRSRLLARAGPTHPDAAVIALGNAALDGEGDLSREIGARFFVARAVEGNDVVPRMALVLSTPTAQFEAARDDLFRVLFIVALAAGAAALALAAFAGERIGSGLRRLTSAAAAIREGDLDVSVGVTTDDELGALGSTFDSMAGSIRHMTGELRTAAAEEAELRARLEAVVAGMGEALVAVDAEGLITDFNSAAEELCDLPARLALGRPVTEVLDVAGDGGIELAERLRRPVLESWTHGGSLRQPGGREVPVVLSAGTLRGPDNDVVGAVFVLRDVRRERELERMKTEFLANISHELRTPLTPIKGFASLMRSRELSPAKTRGFADQIDAAADQMERVIGQLVNFATIVGGRLVLEQHPVAVRTLLDEVRTRWAARLDGSHDLLRRVSAGTPAVLVDRTYAAQLLDELVDNAVKFSPDGGRITLSASGSGADDGRVKISVTDHGVGIAPERLESIFEEFNQGDASATRRVGGLGLGLALVHHIVSAHGGELTCHSTPGEGTRFTVLLPPAPRTATKRGRR